MRYIAQFKNIFDKLYTIILENDAQGEDQELTLGGTPVIINTESEGLFSPIKSRSCSIEIVTDKYHFDLYSPKSREVSVLITDDEDNVIFRGFLTPNSYNQNYTYLDTVQLEARESLSTLKDYTWKSRWSDLTEYLKSYTISEEILGSTPTTPSSSFANIYTQAQDLTYDILKGGANEGEVIEAKDYISFLDLVFLLLKDCGYQGDLYIHDSYIKINTKPISGSSDDSLHLENVFEGLYACSSNFYDDDIQRTPWSLYDVLSEVLNYMNMSMIPYGDDIYIIDYKYLDSEKNNSTFTKYESIMDSTHNVSHVSLYQNLNLENVKRGGSVPNISIDDIYNKIDINDNLYTLDKLSPNIFDEENHVSITKELDFDENEFQFTKENYKKFLWWKYDTTKTVTGYTYQTLCRLKPESGWVHHFYKKNLSSEAEIDNNGRSIYIDNQEIDLSDKNYFDSTSTSQYVHTDVNKYCNTIGALPSHYAYVPELGPNVLPATLEWDDILTFFIVDDTTPPLTFADLGKLEKNVLEYTIDEQINYKPSHGTSWISISGDLFYQYNGANYEITEGKKKQEQVLTIINTDEKIYCTTPVDKAVQGLEENRYCSLVRTPTPPPDNPYYNIGQYGKGFGCWKMRLQIGDKWWSDYWDAASGTYKTGWVDTPTDFYVRYNNNPEQGEEEFLPAFQWMKTCANTTYKDKTGVDAYCIPIAADDDDAPTFGRLYLTLYVPDLLPDELATYFFVHAGTTRISWDQLPCCVFVKNFSLGYIYTDEQVWYKQQGNVNTPDKVYSANIDSDNVNEFSGIELKINTENKDKPISRSYVTTKNGYLHSLEHVNGTPYLDDGVEKIEKEQEWNKIDAYLDHHSERKPIYTAPIDGYYAPYVEFNYGRYLLDTNFNTGISVPYNFVIDEESWDLLYDRNTIKLIAF